MKFTKIGAVILSVTIGAGILTGTQSYNPVTAGAKKSSSSTKKDASSEFWKTRKKKWIHPLKNHKYYCTSKFGSPRSRGRVHAAIDFLVHNDTPVYSMTSGKVYGINKTFYRKGKGGYLHSVEIKNSDGSYAVYGEVQELKSLKIGKKVKRGQKIAYVKSNNDSYGAKRMLHLEVYKGTSSGSFYIPSYKYKYVKSSRGKTFSRRSDLINPMAARSLKKK